MDAHGPVPFVDLTFSAHQDEDVAVKRVLRSGWTVLGDEVREFENSWATRCGVQYGVGVANGLDAIEIGLRALGIGPGDEVITTPMTAIATLLGVLRAGAIPVLADIDPQTALLDVNSVERCLSSRTKAILLVHLYGQIRNMSTWSSLCRSHGILLLEDCAQAHDATEEGRVAGSWGAFGAYSFYPTKNLGAAGDAGALVTNDQHIAQASRSLRNYGQSNRYESPMLGLNSRLDEVQAAILSARLPRLSGWTQRRKQIAETYRSGIVNEAIGLLETPADPASNVSHLFVVTTLKRDQLQAHLRSLGIQTIIHYPIPAHRQLPLKDLPRDPQGLSYSELHSQQCLSLPCAPHLTDDQVERVMTAVNDFTL